MNEKEIMQLVKEIKEENKKFEPKKKENPILQLKKLDQQIYFEEQKRLYLVDRVLIRQFLFPERAEAILDKELLQSLDTDDLKCIIDSYEVSEEEITMLTLNFNDNQLNEKINKE